MAPKEQEVAFWEMRLVPLAIPAGPLPNVRRQQRIELRADCQLPLRLRIRAILGSASRAVAAPTHRGVEVRPQGVEARFGSLPM